TGASHAMEGRQRGRGGWWGVEETVVYWDLAQIPGPREAEAAEAVCESTPPIVPTLLRVRSGTCMLVLTRSVSPAVCPGGPLMTGLASELFEGNPRQSLLSRERVPESLTKRLGNWMPQV